MKRLANLKNSTSSSAPHSEKKTLSKGSKRQWSGKANNPYPESGYITNTRPTAPSTISGRASSFTPASVTSGRVGSFASYEDSTGGPNAPLRSNKSTAPTLATNPETIASDTGFSRAGTTYTDGGIYSSRSGGGANSTFSSAPPSQDSLTTTLTTIQSTAPSALLPTPPTAHTTQQSPVTFSHQYPVSPPPVSALPSHMQHPAPFPQTYTAATANNLLSDNASLLTLASSSKRRRRNSLDTNASVRAIAPSSVWGNSRESLPLSVLSANIDTASTAGAPALPSTAGSGARPGLASAERVSVYSNPGGVGAPALVSERNSYYSTKAAAMDSISVRSGLGHGRAESISGSITDRAAPRENEMVGWASRRTSGWRDGGADVEEETENEEDEDVEEGELVKVDSKGKGKENMKARDGGSIFCGRSVENSS